MNCESNDDRFGHNKKKFDAAKLLVKYKANVNVKNEFGITMLHSAAALGDPRMAKLLLEHGADVNATNKEGYTPLYAMFAYYESGGCTTSEKTEVVKELVEYGADTELVVRGKTMSEVLNRRYLWSGALLAALKNAVAARQEKSGLEFETNN